MAVRCVDHYIFFALAKRHGMMKEPERVPLNQEDEQDEIPFWNDEDLGSTQVGQHLCEAQVQDLSQLLQQFSDVFQLLLGQTTVTEHTCILRQEKHCLCVKYPIQQVDRELKDMFKSLFSNWASPIVVVPKKDRTSVCRLHKM